MTQDERLRDTGGRDEPKERLGRRLVMKRFNTVCFESLTVYRGLGSGVLLCTVQMEVFLGGNPLSLHLQFAVIVQQISL